jgi:NAD(P)H dehydrogenase (quinone)
MSRGFEGTHVAVVYDGVCGRTQQVAEAAARGVASVKGVEALLIKVEDIGQYWGVLERVDGIVFGATTHLGSVSIEFRNFMDATSRCVFARGYKWADKVAAGFTHAASRSGDGLTTLQEIASFAAQHQMHWVNLGLPSGYNDSGSIEDKLYRHGHFIGAASQSQLVQCAGSVAPDADLRTAEFLGARIADVASQLAAGRAILEAFQTTV